MAVEVTIPRLGWNMDEGIFVGWLKEEGETIAAGDPLFSLEGDKSTQDIESLESGVLRIPDDGPQPGQTLAVGTVIAYLLAPGESLPERKTNREAVATPQLRSVSPGELIASSPKETSELSKSNLPRVSPRARRAADELGIDWTTLRGTGSTGRIRERDVRAAALAGSQQRSLTSESRPKPVSDRGAREGQFDSLPVSSIRRTIAQKMMQSSQMMAPVTLTTTVDATNLAGLRRQFKAVAESNHQSSIGYNDIIVALTASALQKHPQLNSRWEQDQILISRGIHIGIAVDTEDGLRVPVIHDVANLTLRQIAARSRTLIEGARKGSLTMADSQGSTFTITNLGPFGIDAFTPIINPPECAILGVGRTRSHAVMVGDRFTMQEQMTLSLTFDHRIVDGAPAARFLQSLSSMIENPSPWLLP